MEAVVRCLDARFREALNIGAAVRHRARGSRGARRARGLGLAPAARPARPAELALRGLELARLSPLAEWHYRTAHKDSFVSIDKARSLLGWEPRLSNAETLCATYDWYLAHRERARRRRDDPSRPVGPARARRAPPALLGRSRRQRFGERADRGRDVRRARQRRQLEVLLIRHRVRGRADPDDRPRRAPRSSAPRSARRSRRRTRRTGRPRGRPRRGSSSSPTPRSPRCRAARAFADRAPRRRSPPPRAHARRGAHARPSPRARRPSRRCLSRATRALPSSTA